MIACYKAQQLFSPRAPRMKMMKLTPKAMIVMTGGDGAAAGWHQ